MIEFQFTLVRDLMSELKLSNSVDWDVDIFSGFLGSFVVSGNGQRCALVDVPLLWIGRSLHMMLTFPAFYREEASVTVPDTTTNIRTSLYGDDISLTISRSPMVTDDVFSGRLIETMGNFGAAYRRLIGDIASSRRDIAENARFMSLLPDGFVLSRAVLHPRRPSE